MEEHIRRLMMQNVKSPSEDLICILFEVFCRRTCCARGDPTLKVYRQELQMAEDAEARIQPSIDTLIKEGYTWDYLYELWHGHFPVKRADNWRDWIAVMHIRIDPLSWAKRRERQYGKTPCSMEVVLIYICRHVFCLCRQDMLYSSVEF